MLYKLNFLFANNLSLCRCYLLDIFKLLRCTDEIYKEGIINISLMDFRIY